MWSNRALELLQSCIKPSKWKNIKDCIKDNLYVVPVRQPYFQRVTFTVHCIKQICHNAPFCKKNTSVTKWCIVGFVRHVFSHSSIANLARFHNVFERICLCGHSIYMQAQCVSPAKSNNMGSIFALGSGAFAMLFVEIKPYYAYCYSLICHTFLKVGIKHWLLFMGCNTAIVFQFIAVVKFSNMYYLIRIVIWKTRTEIIAISYFININMWSNLMVAHLIITKRGH